MTAAQKKARENFKKAIAYRKKTGCSLKQAFAHVKGGKVTGVYKPKITPLQYKGFTINKIGNYYRADSFSGEQFSDKNLKNLKKKINNYLNPKKGGKVGATKIIEKGEKKNAKVTKVLQRIRTKKGTFKGTKRVAGSSHKDTKSHNVNIRVVSGIENIQKLHNNIYDLIKNNELQQSKIKRIIVFNGKFGENYHYSKPEILILKKELVKLKKINTQLKKLAREQQKAVNISK